jgi:hypothetical protein
MDLKRSISSKHRFLLTHGARSIQERNNFYTIPKPIKNSCIAANVTILVPR